MGICMGMGAERGLGVGVFVPQGVEELLMG